MASWRSGDAEDCKSLYPGSIPGEASIRTFNDIDKLSADERAKSALYLRASRCFEPLWFAVGLARFVRYRCQHEGANPVSLKSYLLSVLDVASSLERNAKFRDLLVFKKIAILPIVETARQEQNGSDSRPL
jgi:hypothetical protein